MQEYRSPSHQSPDKTRRWLWAAFILSALVTITLAFCSRRSGTRPAEQVSPEVISESTSPSSYGESSLDDTRPLQSNANRPGFKELNLDQPIYFLLTGLDKREWLGDTGPGLTDTIIVAYLNAAEEKAGLISIPRDTWVDLPDYGFYKINQAYSLGEAYGYPGGGPGILMDTAEDLLGIQIDYYVQVDFEAFVVLVDSVNGVLVDVPEEILVWPNAEMEGDMKRLYPGKQVLPGNLALGYVRTRDTLEGDFGRAKRQQQVLAGLQKKISSYEILPVLIPRLPGLYRDLSSHVETNLTLNQIITLAWAVKGINYQSVQTRVIKEPIVTADINDRGQYILIPDLELVRNMWQDMQEIEATPIPEPTQEPSLEEYLVDEDARIGILNATSSPGLANETAEFLKANDLNIASLGNASKFKDQTVVYDYSGNPQTVRYILELMGYSENRLFYKADPAVDEDIVIVLGSDWALENTIGETN
ncbi:MAG: LCP family protein [Anaerolineales bacterium]